MYTQTAPYVPFTFTVLFSLRKVCDLCVLLLGNNWIIMVRTDDMQTVGTDCILLPDVTLCSAGCSRIPPVAFRSHSINQAMLAKCFPTHCTNLNASFIKCIDSISEYVGGHSSTVSEVTFIYLQFILFAASALSSFLCLLLCWPPANFRLLRKHIVTDVSGSSYHSRGRFVARLSLVSHVLKCTYLC